MDQDTDAPANLSEPPATYAAADEAQTPRSGRTRARSKGVDGQWIEGRLKSLYDAVAAEPLPTELQALVDRLRSEA